MSSQVCSYCFWGAPSHGQRLHAVELCCDSRHTGCWLAVSKLPAGVFRDAVGISAPHPPS